ncbi:MAG: hypothetical protein M3303_15640 [Gemmatimonadota bacterium]|nr:hypothetical protein [Gemmatimonadota bacterium]
MRRSALTLIAAAIAAVAAGCEGAGRATGPEVGGVELNLELLGNEEGTGFVTTGGADITLMMDGFIARRSFVAKRNAAYAVNGEFEFVDQINGVTRTVHGDVLCFIVRDNQARLGGVVTHSNFSSFENRFVAWAVEDNGEGASEPENRDRMNVPTFFVAELEAQAYCSDPSPLVDLLPIETGNIQVHK